VSATEARAAVTDALKPGPRASEGVKPEVYVRRQYLIFLVGIALLAIAPQIWDSTYWLGVQSRVGVYALITLGFYYQFALAGRFSFATTSFFALGAYTSIWASQHGGYAVGLLAAIVASAVVGGLLKLALSRSPLVQFAIATLSFSALSLILFRNWTSFTGGATGRYNVEPISLFGYDFDTPTKGFYAIAAAVLVGVFLLILVERSPMQRDLAFVRDMGEVAKTSGLRSLPLIVAAFAIGAAYMGAAGSLQAHNDGFIDITSFSQIIAFDALLMLLIGGSRSVWGPVLGAVFVIVLPEKMRSLEDYKNLVFAGMILVVILAVPGGLASIPRRVSGLLHGRRR
jgi:branched-chain amino acid transport system permease protein